MTSIKKTTIILFSILVLAGLGWFLVRYRAKPYSAATVSINSQRQIGTATSGPAAVGSNTPNSVLKRQQSSSTAFTTASTTATATTTTTSDLDREIHASTTNPVVSGGSTTTAAVVNTRPSAAAPATTSVTGSEDNNGQAAVSSSSIAKQGTTVATTTARAASSTIVFVGPRQNLPVGAPDEYGFWSFAVPVTGVLSRSGQPTINDFTWLKQNGWKSVVDLRVDNEYNEIADDNKLPGFKALGFNYLHLPMRDGSAPTDAQAQEFLAFVTDPQNQPVHVHCRGGYGRTGALVALYRFAVQHWPMDKAIAESRLFHGGISLAQSAWLEAWAKSHP